KTHVPVGIQDPGGARPGWVVGGSARVGGPRLPRLALPVGAQAAAARAVARLGNPHEGLAALRAAVRVDGTPRRGRREVRAHLVGQGQPPASSHAPSVPLRDGTRLAVLSQFGRNWAPRSLTAKQYGCTL